MQITQEEIILLNAGKNNDAIKSVMKRVPCAYPQAFAIVQRIIETAELKVVEDSKDHVKYANGWTLHRLVA